MTDTRYLIVGNGVAGITAAQEIRRHDTAGRLLVLGNEGEPYYYRASMSEWMTGETTDEMLPGRVLRFYESLRIEQWTGSVTRVDPTAKRAYLDDGREIAYEQLLIATGARANCFPVPGLSEVLVFRTLADVRRIVKLLGCCGRTLIVGGGVLGLELAGALKKMGMEGTAIAHRHGYVGAPLLDARAAEWLQQRIRADGVELFLNDTVDYVKSTRGVADASSVAKESAVVGGIAHLKSGRLWPFDLVVQAVGVSPAYPDMSGLAVGRGVRIDSQCRTNLPAVFAAGDCTETRLPGTNDWRPTRIWLHGAQQGRVAGANMAGRNALLRNEAMFNASILYTVPYAYIGEPHSPVGETYIWEGDNAYRVVRVADGHLAGALLLGERRGSTALLAAIGQPVTDAGPALAHPDYPYNDLAAGDWDYRFY